SRFPTLPTALGNPQEQRIPTFHTATTAGDRLKAPPNPQHPKVGQIKPPKWAKRSCQTHLRLRLGDCSIAYLQSRSAWGCRQLVRMTGSSRGSHGCVQGEMFLEK